MKGEYSVFKKLLKELEAAKSKAPQKIKIHCEVGRMILEMKGEKFYLNLNKEAPDPHHLIGSVVEIEVVPDMTIDDLKQMISEARLFFHSQSRPVEKSQSH